MALTFNPQAFDWQALLAFANVLVAAAIGVAVVWLGRNTKKLTAAVDARRDQALRLDKQTQERSKAAADLQGKLLLLSIFTDLNRLAHHVNAEILRLERPIAKVAFVNDSEFRGQCAERAAAMCIEGLERKLEQAHVLPAALAARLAQIVGGQPALKHGLDVALTRRNGDASLHNDFMLHFGGLKLLSSAAGFITAKCAEIVKELALPVVDLESLENTGAAEN